MGKEFVQHLAEIVLAIGTVAFEIGTRLLQAFKRLCEYLDPTVNDVTQNMIDALNEAAIATRNFILGITEHFNSLMDCGLETFFMNFADTFNKAITACAKVWSQFMYAMDELLDHLDPIANEFTQKLLDDMNSAIVAIGDSFLAFAELVKDFRENGGQSLINAIGDIIVAILDLGVRLTEVSANALTGLFEHLDPSQNEIAKNCIDSFTQFAEQIRDALGTIGNAFERFMGESGGQNVVNNLADIVLLIADFAATLAGDIVDTIASFFDSFAGHMVIDLAAAALELLTKALKGLLEILNGPLAPLIEGLIAGFGALVVVQKVATFFGPLITLFQTLAAPGGLMAVATGLVTKLAAAFPLLTNPVGLTVAAIAALAVGMVALYNKCEPFRELVDKIIEGFKGFTEAVEKHMLPIIERVKNIFGNVIDIIVGIFEGDGEKVGEAVRNLVENIVMLIGQLSVAFVEVGWNLIKGLVQGIWECVKAIPKLLAGVGEFIIDFFKGLFGIHSPSTVFAEIGEFMIQGLVQGLSNFKDVIKALKDMATNIVTEAGTKLKEAGTKCVEKIKDGLSTAAKTLKDKGKDIVDGIKEGCKNNWDKLKETGKTLGSKIKDGFCNILGINSPSRVMKEQGKHIVDGVKQGVESNKSAVAIVAKALGLSIDTNTLQGMSKLTANVSSAISKMSTNASSAMKKAVTGMVNAFDGIGNKISAKFKTVETTISKVSTNIKTTVTKMVDNLKKAFNFEWNLPKIKLPTVKVDWTKDNMFNIKMPKFSVNN